MIQFAIGLGEKYLFLQHFMSFLIFFFNGYIFLHFPNNQTDYKIFIFSYTTVQLNRLQVGYYQMNKTLNPNQFSRIQKCLPLKIFLIASFISEEHYETHLFFLPILGGNWLVLTTGVVRVKITFSLKNTGSTI